MVRSAKCLVDSDLHCIAPDGMNRCVFILITAIRRVQPLVRIATYMAIYAEKSSMAVINRANRSSFDDPSFVNRRISSFTAFDISKKSLEVVVKFFYQVFSLF